MTTSQSDAHSLTLTKLYDAPRQLLFEAWTDPVYLREWMCPEGLSVPVVEVDVRVGGSFRIDMQSERGVTTHRGIYREIVPPQRLVFTWISEGTQFQESLVTIELVERGAQTELILNHTQFLDATMTEMHVGGWTSILQNLSKHLQNR
jgi:uncharacterized protein YndB with AHSA1/START domain